MIRFKLVIVPITLLLLLGGACSLQLPESVRIKTAPNLQVPGGNRQVKLADVWDIQSALEEAASADEGLSVADTQEGDPLALSLDKPLVSVAVNDFADENLNLDAVNQTIDVSYSVPTIGFAGESFESNIDPIAVPAGVSVPGVSLTDLPEIDGALGPLSQSIAAEGFSSVTFEQGTLTANVTVDRETESTLTVDITQASILDPQDGTTIVSADTSDLAETDLQFPLAGTKLPASFDIELEFSLSGATLGNVFDINLSFVFSADTRISGASGINFVQTVSGTYSIPVDSTLDFQQATVRTGSLMVGNSFPADWTGISDEVTVTLSQNGTTLAGPAQATTVTPLDLAGVTLVPANIDVAYEVTVDGTNATFALDAANPEVMSSIDGGIAEFSSIDIDSATFDAGQSVSMPVDQSTRDLVESVIFLNPVLDIQLNNQLPIDVNVNISSTTFSGANTTGVTAKQVTFAPDASSTKSFPQSADTTNSWDISPGSIGDPFYVDMASIDVDVGVELDDGSIGDGTTTLTNVVPGDTYTLSGQVTGTFELDELTIANATITDQFPATGAAGLDFSSVSSFLPNELEFDSISSSLSFNDGGSSGSFSLYLEADWAGNSEPLVLIEDPNAPDPGQPKPLSSGTDEQIDLGTIINGRPSELFFYYTIVVTGATIDVDGGAAGQEISTVLSGNIPLSFSASADAELTDDNGDPIVPTQEGDLLGRSGEDDGSELGQALDSIDSATLYVEVTNNIGLSGLIEVSEPDFSGTRTIELSQGDSSFELSISPEELTYPFTPQTRVFLTDTTGTGESHRILTGGDLSLSVWIETQANIDLNFSLTGDSE